MLTPQEVSNHAFAKAAFGGYNMAMVDEFLDELTDDYSALYKENAALKAKMKVLVDKVEEYRSTEDSMRAALLTAQKMATTMVSEAEAKRDRILANAEAEMRNRTAGLQDELLFEQKRLNTAKTATAAFIENVKGVYSAQLEFLEKLPDLTPETIQTPAADKETEHSEVSAIEEKILSAFSAPQDEKAAEENPGVQQDLLDSEAGSFVETDTRAIRLEDLKFGRNYKAEE